MDEKNIKQIKLIASDLDGTLLQHGVQNCSEEAIMLIAELVKKGIYFMPASGRQYVNLKRLFADTKQELIYLCENGALVVHKEQVLLKRMFDRALALELSHMIMEEPDCEVLISGERTCYVIPKSQAYVDHLRYEVKNDVTVLNCPEEIKEDIIKVSYFTSESRLKEITEKFAKRVDGRCRIVVSGNQWVDFAPHGTSKASALEEVGKLLHIKPEEMIAFGDNENDREMLTYVGHPYLMKKCNPTMEDIKAVRCNCVEEELRKLLAAIPEKD